jgi:pyruvate/2-oxoglutarate dehydrogenase complex dihydrolipoamide dehydrogenase (E3) component
LSPSQTLAGSTARGRRSTGRSTRLPHSHGRDGFATHWQDDGPAGLVKGFGAELVRGHGRLDGRRRVAVETLDDGRVVLSARYSVAVCTGSRPAVPNLPGIAEARPWISRDATSANAVPERLAIIGVGPVGVEMSSA